MKLTDICRLQAGLSSQSYLCQVPGKLYIAGEYAVLDQGQPAILIAVDQYLHAEIRPGTGIILSDSLADSQLLYQDGVFTADDLGQWTYVIKAVQVFESLRQALGLEERTFDLSLRSELVDDSGRKYGLGSSGAVVIACLRALLEFYQIELVDSLYLFKLAALAVTATGSRASLADLAASIYGGWVYYRQFDRSRLIQRADQADLWIPLLLEEWPGLVIEQLPAPNSADLLIGWTGSPASTDNLVDQVNSGRQLHEAKYQIFLDKSRDLVDRMRQALLDQDLSQFMEGIRQCRIITKQMAEDMPVTIETNQLSKLIEIADGAGYASKVSGAGGGDCGIALGPLDQVDRQAVQASWQEQGIIPLNIQVANRQVEETNHEE